VLGVLRVLTYCLRFAQVVEKTKTKFIVRSRNCCRPRTRAFFLRPFWQRIYLLDSPP